MFQISHFIRSYWTIILKLSYFFLKSIFRFFSTDLSTLFKKNTSYLLYCIVSTHYHVCYKFALRMYLPRVSNLFLHSRTDLIMLLFSYYNLRSFIINDSFQPVNSVAYSVFLDDCVHQSRCNKSLISYHFC